MLCLLSVINPMVFTVISLNRFSGLLPERNSVRRSKANLITGPCFVQVVVEGDGFVRSGLRQTGLVSLLLGMSIR
jgi:hypothetical protein